MPETKQCGCKLKVLQREGYSITYCPLHGAAPDMLTALERIATHQSRADRRHRGMVDASELEDLQRTARTAVDRAKGK